MVTQTDVAIILGNLAFILGLRTGSQATPAEMREIYKGPLPSAFFGIMWAINYMLIYFSSTFLFISTGIDPASVYYIPLIVLYILFCLGLYFWTPVFFDYRKFTLAIVFIVLPFLFGVVYLVLTGLAGQYVAMGLMIVPVAFLIVALVLNIQFLGVAENTQQKKPITNLPMQPKIPKRF